MPLPVKPITQTTEQKDPFSKHQVFGADASSLWIQILRGGRAFTVLAIFLFAEGCGPKQSSSLRTVEVESGGDGSESKVINSLAEEGVESDLAASAELTLDENSDREAVNDVSTENRQLPMPPEANDNANTDSSENGGADSESATDDSVISISTPLTEEEKKTPVDDFVTPDQIASKAFADPPGSIALTKTNLWVDRDKTKIYLDGYVAMNDGPLEMFACPAGTKEHESVVASIPKPSEVHAALIAIGAESGKPSTVSPEFMPATGQRIRIWVCYRDNENRFQFVDARDWIVRIGTTDTLKEDWVFVGSSVWTDPRDGISYYEADAGDMICVSNFSTAMLDIPVASSASSDFLEYSPNTKRIPERGTPVRLVLIPLQDEAGEDDEAGEEDEAAKDDDASDANPGSGASWRPSEAVLPLRE